MHEIKMQDDNLHIVAIEEIDPFQLHRVIIYSV